MGCGSSAVDSEPRNVTTNTITTTTVVRTEHETTVTNSHKVTTHHHQWNQHHHHIESPTPPSSEPTSTPREMTPSLEPTPSLREPTPSLEPTPPPPREPTPPTREPTPPHREPTPPPREPTPPPREPTPPPQKRTRPPPPPKKKHTRQDRKPQPTGKSNSYRQQESGIYECDYIEFRQKPDKLDKDYENPPTGPPPFVDKDFGPGVAIKGESVEWKRPHEFRDAPVLFSDGTTRYDIGQGSAGTCWFMSIVAMLAEQPKLFHRVVPQDAWNPKGGYFYCYFWRFGEWERVFIDDFLPIIHETELWGAKSADDRQEMWPALLEKAFARFHGNYGAVYGGQAGDAFLSLTGGYSEFIDLAEELVADAKGSKVKKAIELHNRLKNAFMHGESMITTEVPERGGFCGLVGNHAYSLTGAVKVNSNGKNISLVRVRNPWGHKEWTGPWSDRSKEWGTLDDPKSVPHVKKDDGEFYMSLKDFIKYFSSVTVCSMIPDFHKDGCRDPRRLDHCTSILGDWVEESAVGCHSRTGNPRYMFELSEKGMDDDGQVPIVIQICQKMKHRQSQEESIRVDLYKIINENSNGQPFAMMQFLEGETDNYRTARQNSDRYKVKPGKYAVVPSTLDAGREKEFVVRVYTPCPLKDVRELGRDYAITETSELKSLEEAIAVNHCTTIFGEWLGETAAGFQNKTDNPRYMFELSNEGMDGDGQVPIVIQICRRQPNDEAIRVDLYKILREKSDGQPMSVMELLSEETDDYSLERQKSERYKVKPGKYAVVPSTLEAGREKEFLVRVYTSCPLDVRELGRNYAIMESSEFKSPDKAISIKYTETVFGRWRQGHNAGGLVSYDTFYKNPQMEFTIPGNGGGQIVNFTVIQENGKELYPIGLRLFVLDSGHEIKDSSKHQDYLLNHYDRSPKTVDRQQGAFMNGSSADITHKLSAGRYFVIFHLDGNNQEKRFVVIVRSSCKMQTRKHRFE